VSAVELSVDGSVVDVPVADGQLRSGPVTRADYAAIAPPPHRDGFGRQGNL
jgi:hypothetical protein